MSPEIELLAQIVGGLAVALMSYRLGRVAERRYWMQPTPLAELRRKR